MLVGCLIRNFKVNENITFKNDYSSEEYYLFLVGVKHPNISPHFATFDNEIKSLLNKKGYQEQDFKNFHQSIFNFY